MKGDQGLRILLVDDDEDIRDLLKYIFKKEGFQVKAVSKIKKAITAAQRFRPQLIILDILMPDGNGIELCREMRSRMCFKDTSIFFLSAHADNKCKDAAFATGADDFIEKLSGLRALTNKVNAVLKNKFTIKKGIPTLSSNGLVLDKRLEIVSYRNRNMILSEPEFEILFFLMQNANKVVSRKTLINIIWGSEIFVLGSSVENYIESLHRKIGREFIETVSSGQYRFRINPPLS